jgi:preprotein translocase subunit SecE
MAAISQWWPNTRNFVREVVAEAKKVTWPDRRAVVGTTIVVIAATLIIGFYLSACDLVLGKALEAVYKALGV